MIQFNLSRLLHYYIALNYYEKVYLLGVPAECHCAMGKNANKQLLPGISINHSLFFQDIPIMV